MLSAVRSNAPNGLSSSWLLIGSAQAAQDGGRKLTEPTAAPEESMSRRGLLLLNLGTPEGPDVHAVRRYLREFLMDPRVLDVPWALRALLVHGIIAPFRARSSAAAYRKIWTERGSPLLVHGLALAEKLRGRLGESTSVEVGMRYQSPSIRWAVRKLRGAGVDHLVCFPLFPHNASSSWGSAAAAVYREAARWWDVPSIEVIPPYYDNPAYLDALSVVAGPVLRSVSPETTILSFHGLPVRHLRRSDTGCMAVCRMDSSCCASITQENRNCYRAQCFATARGLAERLGWAEADYLVTFQSRLGRDPWIRPFTGETIAELAAQGVRRLAVLSPSFTADCLETLEEIGMRARDDFVARGGEELALVPGLNSEDAWVDAVVQMLGGA